MRFALFLHTLLVIQGYNDRIFNLKPISVININNNKLYSTLESNNFRNGTTDRVEMKRRYLASLVRDGGEMSPPENVPLFLYNDENPPDEDIPVESIEGVILWLTIVNKFKFTLSSLKKKLSNIVVQDNGTKYQDIVMGNGKYIEPYSTVSMNCSLYYNGLLIEHKHIESYTFGSAANYSSNSLPNNNLVNYLNGMRIGGTRKINLPPHLAFGDDGYQPFIPPDASVIYEISILSS